MMQEEFETLVGYKVSSKFFDDVISPAYLASKLDKRQFSRRISKILDREAIEEKPEPNYIIIRVPDRSGYYTTPNGCWYYYRIAEVVDIDIASGKYVVKQPSEVRCTSDTGDRQYEKNIFASVYRDCDYEVVA